jgi:hypothetical protein
VPDNIIQLLTAANQYEEVAAVGGAAVQNVAEQSVSLQEFANTGSILVGIEPAFKTMVSVAIAHKMGLFAQFDPQEEQAVEEQQEVPNSSPAKPSAGTPRTGRKGSKQQQ